MSVKIGIRDTGCGIGRSAAARNMAARVPPCSSFGIPNPVSRILVAAARHVLVSLSLPVEVQEVAPNADPEQMLRASAANARELDRGDGVLVLSDLYGATPCNIAQRLPNLGVHMHCVTGLNLPMLLRVLNY